MRRFLAVAIGFIGCGTATEVVLHGEPEAGAPDAAVDAAMFDVKAVGPLVCTEENTGTSCITAPVSRCGDAGYRYRCYGGTCPMADSGVCFLLETNPSARWTDTCCERLACTRVVGPQDQNCIEADAGRYKGWECADETPPPGDCVLYGLKVATPTGADYCCR